MTETRGAPAGQASIGQAREQAPGGQTGGQAGGHARAGQALEGQSSGGQGPAGQTAGGQAAVADASERTNGVLPRTGSVLIGLTGPTGCGKTTVAGWLAERGAAIVDADDLTREVMGKGTAAAEAVIAHFGERYRRPDGSLDRAALGRLVFGDPARLAELEAIVHPAIRLRILEEIRRIDGARPAAIVLEAIKLVEAGYAADCDEVWLVICDPEVQHARLLERGVDPVDAEQRRRAQAGSLPVWRRAATRVLRTDGSRQRVEALVDEAFREALGARDR